MTILSANFDPVKTYVFQTAMSDHPDLFIEARSMKEARKISKNWANGQQVKFIRTEGPFVKQS